jgi:hypothetical protein
MEVKSSRSKGYSLIELIFVMVLLILFGLTSFTLVVSGSSTYKKLTNSRNSNSELRVALSYVNMKVRQNDELNSIRVDNISSSTGSSALVISKTMGGKPYETWIYCSRGRLREAIVRKGIQPVDDLSTEIAEISGFKVYFMNDKRKLYIEVSKPFGKAGNIYSSVIALKTNL